MQNATSPHMPSGPSSSSTCQPGSSQQQLQQSPAKKETEEFDDEDLDALLESDPLPSGYREARLAQLTEELNSAQAHAHAHELSHTPQGEILDRKGSLTEMKDEKSLIELSSREPFCVIHFFHPDFQRCRIMDRHLDILAKRHKHTLFLKAAVENAPFLVDRLGVKVLPCVISFVDGNARDRIVGFEDLGGVDDFPTASLEFRLRNAGVLPPTNYVPPKTLSSRLRTIRSKPGAGERSDDSEEDGDEDYTRDKTGRRKDVRSIRQGNAGRGRNVNEDEDDWA